MDEKAHSTGLERDDYICAVLSKEVAGEPSISEILAPFRDQVANNGISDEGLNRLFSEAREESYRERRSRRIDER